MNLQAFRCALILLEAIYCRLGYRQDNFCLDGLVPCWSGANFELPVYLAPPLEGNLFPSCYCIVDVFLFTLQEQHQTVACEGVYWLHEIRVSSTWVSPCDTAGGADGVVGRT